MLCFTFTRNSWKCIAQSLDFRSYLYTSLPFLDVINIKSPVHQLTRLPFGTVLDEKFLKMSVRGNLARDSQGKQGLKMVKIAKIELKSIKNVKKCLYKTDPGRLAIDSDQIA